MVERDNLGGHQARRQPQTLRRTVQVVGAAAGFDAAPRAGQQSVEPVQKASSVELLPHHDPPSAVGHAGHEDVFCKIHTNRRNIDFDFTPHR